MSIENMIRYAKNIRKGIPYFVKEIESFISVSTPFFIARPKIIYVWFSGQCNGKCIMCPQSYQDKNIFEEHDSKMAEVLIDRLKEAKKSYGGGLLVSFICGEPLMYPPLFSIMETCRRLELDFSFTTNGYLLSKQNVTRIGRADPFNIGVSIESLNANTNEKLRPVKNGTRKTLEGINRLIEEQDKNNRKFSINIKCTLTQYNYWDLIDIVKIYGKKKNVFITPQPIEAQDGVPKEIIKDLLIKDRNDFQKAMKEIIKLKKEGYSVNADERNFNNFSCEGNAVKKVEEVNTFKYSSKKKSNCAIGTSHLFISGTGGIKLCPFMDDIGNICSEKLLKEIWNGAAAIKVRKRITNCSRICNYSCTRSSSIWNKVILFLRR